MPVMTVRAAALRPCSVHLGYVDSAGAKPLDRYLSQRIASNTGDKTYTTPEG